MDSGLYLSGDLWELFLKPRLLLGRSLLPPAFVRWLDMEQGVVVNPASLCIALLDAGFGEGCGA